MQLHIVNKLLLTLLEFVGYLWNLLLYLLVIPTLVVMLSQGLDFLVLNVWLDVDAGLNFGSANVIVILFSLLVGGTGLLIILEAALTLYHEAKTLPFAPFVHHHVPPSELAQSGWFNHIRHPMLLGYLFILIGIGVYLHLLTMVLWWVPLLGAAWLQYLVWIEEKQLIQWFGDDYARYRQEVPALIPRFKRPTFLTKKTKKKRK